MSKIFKLNTEQYQKIVMRTLDSDNYRIRRDVKGYLKQSGARGVVLGVSGGIDSALTKAICVDVLGADRVLAIMMPYDNKLHAENTRDAIDLCEQYGVRYTTVPIKKSVDALVKSMKWEDPKNINLLKGNIMARVRMTVLYHYAWMNKMIVAGTSNKPELYTGYFTKYGDGGADIEVIATLLKSQVRELAREYNVPEKIINKSPSANLWEGQTDEAELGFTYDEMDYIIHYWESLGGMLYQHNEPKMRDFLKPIVDVVGWDRFLRLKALSDKNKHKSNIVPKMGVWGIFHLKPDEK